MSNIIHKMSEKITGHDHHDDERDEQGNSLSSEQRQQREQGMPFTEHNDPEQRAVPSQRVGGGGMQSERSKLGGYQQQQHDLGGSGGEFGQTRSMPSEQMPGAVRGGSDMNAEDWDEEEEADDEGRGTRRGGDYSDEFQKRYW
ncbi:LAQU0S08e03268g1_1 [Lachancea quebecensis]|uniref:LAQU0S08e03268g1_1 n=1 Tax=Lachancea quebecensis TaxID=1654605 RepID=A0A0P1KTC4_9SACH|nr:LAQU0S08e03268g1_1 [Lachancea quebecensis]